MRKCVEFNAIVNDVAIALVISLAVRQTHEYSYAMLAGILVTRGASVVLLVQ